MPIAFEVEELVARSPAVVWQRLTHWRSAPDWMSGVESLEPEGPTEVGTVLVFQARGQERETEITHLVEGREVTLSSGQGPVTANYRYECRPHGEGTRLRLVAECELSGPLRLAGPLLRWLIRRTDGGQLRALKTLLEAS